MGFDVGFKMGDFFFEVPLLLNMALFPNSDDTDQRGGNPSESDYINVSFHGEGYGDGLRGSKAFNGWGFLYLWFRERERVGGYGA
jgi:hypothetical protein